MHLQETPLLSVIVPVYNERGTVADLLRRVMAVPLPKEIIVIDDQSTDGSYEIVQELARNEPAIRSLRQERNQGKGAALRRGIAEARGEIVIIQDADLEYEPAEYPRLVQPILDGHADVVYGSRFAGHPRRVMMYWHTLGNSVLTWLSNILTNLNLTDMETCYKVFRREVIQSIRIESNRFGFEPEITAKISRRGYRIYEVPISYHGREYWEGKKINWKDGVSAIWTIVKHNLLTSGDSEPDGYVTLERMASLKHYNNWILDRFRSYMGQRVLEVGSGTGNMTRLLYGRELIVATDMEPAYLHILRNRFRRQPTIKVEPLDLENDDWKKLRDYGFDTVVCLNVLEHIKGDQAALERLYDLLVPGGRLMLFVPADQALFGTLDTQVGHHRRYSPETLESVIRAAGFEIRQLSYHNVYGRLGWWMNGRILKRRHLPAAQSKIFDFFVPLLRKIEGSNPKKGLSLVAVAERPMEARQVTAQTA
ncbi:MAG TPA: glycosyltransferase [Thermoanaerobaculia bacterium]|jgi:glycosyltransferase involved in cell wall biosynthesis